jgi:hypothetical protein
MPPAEDALVGAGQAGRRFHAAVRLDAVETVLVAASAASQLSFRPAADLDSGMGTWKEKELLVNFSAHGNLNMPEN